MSPDKPKTWEELRYHILAQLEKIDEMEREMGKMKLELGIVKSKLTVLVSGASSLIALFVSIIANHVGGSK